MSLPYDYYPAVLYAIDLISQGYTHTAACDESNILIPTFKSYIAKDQQLQDLLAEADVRGRDAMADALVQIGYHKLYGETDPKMAKVISDNIKWLLARRDQKRFGDRVVVDHNITADRAITDALAAGRRRASLAHSSQEVIDLEPVVGDVADDIIMQQILAGCTLVPA